LIKQVPYDFKRAYPFEHPTTYPIVNYTFDPVTQDGEQEKHGGHH
jgi:hypothetical protein